MIARATTYLVTSFSIISVLGSIFFLLRSWSTRGEVAISFDRSVLFVIMMAAVHDIGYELYVRQFPPIVPPWLSQLGLRETYRDDCWKAGILHVVCIGLSALIPDGGEILHICIVSAAIHWTCIIFIVLRRRCHPTEFDMTIIQIGYLYVVIGFGLFAAAVQPFIGQ